MADKYIIRQGDTFASIAANVYGDDQRSSKISDANPGVAEPLVAGQAITIPRAPSELPQARADGSDITISVNGARYRFWSDVTINMAIDSIPTIELTTVWDPSDATLRETFRPFGYQDVGVQVGGSTLFTGTLVGIVPDFDDEQGVSTLTVGAYSTPGVLNDCTAPASAYPNAVEFNDMTLGSIAKALAGFFGIEVSEATSPGAAFGRVALNPAERITGFLASLASQRNALLSATPEGRLLIWRADTTAAPVATLTQGESPLVSVAPFFDPQQHYSTITGIEPVVVGLAGAQYTVRNAALTSAGVQRPYTYEASDTVGGDVPTAVQTKAGRMYGATVSYEVELSTWFDPTGNVWRPNTIVVVDAPAAMVYRPTRLLVRSVTLKQTESARTAALSLVLPESFAGEVPEVMPWD